MIPTMRTFSERVELIRDNMPDDVAWNNPISLADVFEVARELGRAQLSAHELEDTAGFNRTFLATQVRAGRLRRGVQGYWLPEPLDPGFLAATEPLLRQRR